MPFRVEEIICSFFFFPTQKTQAFNLERVADLGAFLLVKVQREHSRKKIPHFLKSLVFIVVLSVEVSFSLDSTFRWMKRE